MASVRGALEAPAPAAPNRALAPVAVVAALALWAVGARLLPNGLPPGAMLLGLVFGSLYALGAAGLVLVYRASRVVNFAGAEIGGLAAVLAIELNYVLNVNY